MVPLRMRKDLLQFKSSPIHGRGAFANRRITQGTRLIEYVGRKISKADALKECEANNPFIFVIDGQYDLDGNVEWNPARLINHSCEPNCDVEWLDGGLWVVARRDIERGEEITFNYGYDLEDYRDYHCHCGAPNCVGYMVAEELFTTVRARSRSNRSRQPR